MLLTPLIGPIPTATGQDSIVAIMSFYFGLLQNLPLKLVEHFKEDTSKATIQLEAPNDMIYGVEACKHGDDQIVLQYGWNNLVLPL